MIFKNAAPTIEEYIVISHFYMSPTNIVSLTEPRMDWQTNATPAIGFDCSTSSGFNCCTYGNRMVLLNGSVSQTWPNIQVYERGEIGERFQLKSEIPKEVLLLLYRSDLKPGEKSLDNDNYVTFFQSSTQLVSRYSALHKNKMIWGYRIRSHLQSLFVAAVDLQDPASSLCKLELVHSNIQDLKVMCFGVETMLVALACFDKVLLVPQYAVAVYRYGKLSLVRGFGEDRRLADSLRRPIADLLEHQILWRWDDRVNRAVLWMMGQESASRRSVLIMRSFRLQL